MGVKSAQDILNQVVDWAGKIFRTREVGQNLLIGVEVHRLWDNSDAVNTLGRPQAGQAGTEIAFAIPTDIPAGGNGWLEIYNQSPDFGLVVKVKRIVTLNNGARKLNLHTFPIPKNTTTAGSECEGVPVPITGLIAGESISIALYNDTAVPVAGGANAHAYMKLRAI